MKKKTALKVLATTIIIAVIMGNLSIMAKTKSIITCGSNPTTSAQGKSNTYTIVDTGQSKCYSDTTQITAPESNKPFYGQDAQYESIKMQYKDNGDGTITDLSTGLMWQKGTTQKISWEEAVSNASKVNSGGVLSTVC